MLFFELHSVLPKCVVVIVADAGTILGLSIANDFSLLININLANPPISTTSVGKVYVVEGMDWVCTAARWKTTGLVPIPIFHQVDRLKSITEEPLARLRGAGFEETTLPYTW